MSRARKINYLIWVRIIVLVSCTVFIYIRLSDVSTEDLKRDLNLLRANSDYFLIIPVILLMPLNWFLEALRWKILTASFERLSIAKSFFSVCTGIFTGVFVNIFLPGRSGDFAGRILYLQAGNRVNGIASSFVGSIAQNSVTLGAAAIGMALLSTLSLVEFVFAELITYYLLLILTAFATITFLIAFFNYKILLRLVLSISRLRKYKFAFLKLMRYSSGNLSLVWLLSVIRYLVFFLQFYLLLVVFRFPISILESFAIISMIFFIQSVIPSGIITDLGIRGVSAVYFFSKFKNELLLCMAPSYTLWAINVVVPSVLGFLFFLFYRFKNT